MHDYHSICALTGGAQGAMIINVIGNCCHGGGMPTRIANAILAELAAEPTLF